MSRGRLLVPPLVAGLLLVAAGPAATAPPPVGDVAAVYPHLAEARSYLSPREPVAFIRADCSTGAVVEGAFSRGLSYPPADPAAADPAATATGAAPLVTATVIRFPTKARAVRYLRGAATYAERCPSDPDPLVADEVSVADFPAELHLGDARSAYTTTETVAGVTSVSHRITVRTGRVVIVSGVRSADGVAPGWRRAVAFTKLVVRSVLPVTGGRRP